MTETTTSARQPSAPRQRCSRCVLSAAFPSIKFDAEGVCNFCRNELGSRSDDAAIDRGRAMVAELFATPKARGATYDAVNVVARRGSDESVVERKRKHR